MSLCVRLYVRVTCEFVHFDFFFCAENIAAYAIHQVECGAQVCMRPSATSVCALRLVYAPLGY